MISQIAEAISAFFYSMDVIDEEEKGKSRYGIEIIISTIIGFSVIIISGILLSKTNLAIASCCYLHINTRKGVCKDEKL